MPNCANRSNSQLNRWTMPGAGEAPYFRSRAASDWERSHFLPLHFRRLCVLVQQVLERFQRRDLFHDPCLSLGQGLFQPLPFPRQNIEGTKLFGHLFRGQIGRGPFLQSPVIGDRLKRMALRL